MEKLQRSLWLIAQAMESGYSSLFTFAVKENLDREERKRLSLILQNLALSTEELSRLSSTPVLSENRLAEQGRNVLTSSSLQNPEPRPSLH